MDAKLYVLDSSVMIFLPIFINKSVHFSKFLERDGARKESLEVFKHDNSIRLFCYLLLSGV
jgi:hypothetical protein